MVAISEDGSYVYFVANGDLAAGATSGQPNLYLYHGATTTFIATLDPSSDYNDWSIIPNRRPVRVTPDGTHLAFDSSASLSGYNNTDAASGQPDSEVYLYSAASDQQLTCVSCNPSGARPIGPSTLTSQETDNYSQHNLSTTATGCSSTATTPSSVTPVMASRTSTSMSRPAPAAARQRVAAPT